MERIRNFVVIAHVDHGKSTLADRFLELTGTVEPRKMREQFLDRHPLERERGITIKMQPVRMLWRPKHAEKLEIGNWKLESQRPNSKNQTPSSSDSKQEFVLNLIDTPGHSDFSYEVSRALAAVEGAILLVDSTQGVQAQTVANWEVARAQGLAVVPAVNKIDLPSAEVEKTIEEVSRLLGVAPESVLRISAKDGTGVEELLRAVCECVPAPDRSYKTDKSYRTDRTYKDVLRALVFDSLYDPYQGVIAHIRVADGEIRKGDRLRFVATGAQCDALELGYFLPERTQQERIAAGEIGYVATGIKEPDRVRVGDTLTHRSYRTDRTYTVEPLPGYREPQPVVFASVFPENQDNYPPLGESLKKLKLEDAALSFEPEEAGALGRGFRLGFLGLLHMEIVAERLRREYNLRLILSHPSVAFRVRTRDGRDQIARSAARFPEFHQIVSIEEPIAELEIITPSQFLGVLAQLVHEIKGSVGDAAALASDRLRMRALAPLRGVVEEFYERVKSASEGYASFSYEVSGYRPADLVRLDILVAGERVPAFSEIVDRDDAYRIGRERVGRLKNILPRSLFTVSLQALVEGKIIARETISALKKDVAGYLYGGDRTRKMKLWKKQQRGKKRLRERGRVEIPPDVFMKMARKSA